MGAPSRAIDGALVMNVGIVGHEAAKFTRHTEERARSIIRSILRPGDVVISGHCHLGGVDIWAEEEAASLGLQTLIFPPKRHSWFEGYRPRNILIAQHSDIVHCIVVAVLPPAYQGMHFASCYHCHTNTHIKSGGCWTALRCANRQWHIVGEKETS